MPRATPTRINEDGDIEKLCGVCGEWWYLDDEFFNRNSSSGNLASPCKACCIEIAARAKSYPCALDGCTQPRYGRISGYCRDHYFEICQGRPAPKRKIQQKQRRLRNQNYS